MSDKELKSYPKCGCKNIVKNGNAFGKQRYLCKNKECSYNFTVVSRRGYLKSKKQEAINWYLEGSSLRSISRMLKVSLTTIIRWIRQVAKKSPKVKQKYHRNRTSSA